MIQKIMKVKFDQFQSNITLALFHKQKQMHLNLIHFNINIKHVCSKYKASVITWNDQTKMICKYERWNKWSSKIFRKLKEKFLCITIYLPCRLN